MVDSYRQPSSTLHPHAACACHTQLAVSARRIHAAQALILWTCWFLLVCLNFFPTTQAMSLSSSVALATFASTSTVVSTSAAASTSILALPPSSRTSYLSSTLTSLIACLTPMCGLIYLVVLSWAWRHSTTNPKALNKTSGVLIQRHAPRP